MSALLPGEQLAPWGWTPLADIQGGKSATVGRSTWVMNSAGSFVAYVALVASTWSRLSQNHVCTQCNERIRPSGPKHETAVRVGVCVLLELEPFASACSEGPLWDIWSAATGRRFGIFGMEHTGQAASPIQKNPKAANSRRTPNVQNRPDLSLDPGANRSRGTVPLFPNALNDLRGALGSVSKSHFATRPG